MEPTYRIRKRTTSLEVEVEGDRDFVLEHFERLWEAANSSPSGVNHAGAGAPRGLSMAEYVNSTGARSNTEVSLAITAYLFDERGSAEFTTQAVNEGFREILRPLPGNTSQALAQLVQQGLVTKAGKQQGVQGYRITQTGLGRVRHAMSNSQSNPVEPSA